MQLKSSTGFKYYDDSIPDYQKLLIYAAGSFKFKDSCTLNPLDF